MGVQIQAHVPGGRYTGGALISGGVPEVYTEAKTHRTKDLDSGSNALNGGSVPLGRKAIEDVDQLLEAHSAFFGTLFNALGHTLFNVITENREADPIQGRLCR